MKQVITKSYNYWAEKVPHITRDVQLATWLGCSVLVFGYFLYRDATGSSLVPAAHTALLAALPLVLFVVGFVVAWVADSLTRFVTRGEYCLCCAYSDGIEAWEIAVLLHGISNTYLTLPAVSLIILSDVLGASMFPLAGLGVLVGVLLFAARWVFDLKRRISKFLPKEKNDE